GLRTSRPNAKMDKDSSTGREAPTFYPDRPISSAEQDQLGRAKFARDCAVRLIAWPGTESLVVAIHGKWGSGKSSIKNMVLEALRKEPATCPFIIEFNPWEISGQHQLTQSFFRAIAKELGKESG